jgi:hypothetical protein
MLASHIWKVLQAYKAGLINIEDATERILVLIVREV